MVLARDARSEPDDRAFDRQDINSIPGTLNNPSAMEDGSGILRDVPRAPVARPEQPVAAPTLRGVTIHQKYRERFGYSEGCAKCRAILRSDVRQPTLSHSALCRARIREAMAGEKVLNKILQAAQERQDRLLAGEVARGSKRKDAGTEKTESPQTSFVREAARDQEDNLPESGSQEDAKVPEVKRQRKDKGEAHEDEARAQVAEDDEPETKRPRVRTVTVGSHFLRLTWQLRKTTAGMRSLQNLESSDVSIATANSRVQALCFVI